MKKHLFSLIALILIGLASCQDPAKSRILMDEGNRLMMNYGKFDEAIDAFDKAIKYDKGNC